MRTCLRSFSEEKKHIKILRFCDWTAIYPCQNHKILFLELYEKNIPESSKKTANFLFLGLWGGKMLCQFQKTANFLFFGTMSKKSVLPVPKSLWIAIFWNYTRKTRPESSKANINGEAWAWSGKLVVSKLSSVFHKEVIICPDIGKLCPFLDIHHVFIKVVYFCTLHGQKKGWVCSNDKLADLVFLLARLTFFSVS